MTPTLRTAYWHDAAARQAFKDFILEIHGVDFEEWDRAGYWDDDYRPYSFFEGNRVVASLCIYTMPAIVHGQRCDVAQVSGVGTLAEYRRRGLNRSLHELALPEALARHRFVFLFADDEAIPFYRHCGFTPVAAHAVVVPLVPGSTSVRMEKLDIGDASVRRWIYGLAQQRSWLSNTFATKNPKLVMYHLLYRFREHAWRIPDLDAVALMKPGHPRTVLYDLIAREMPAFAQLAPFLAASGAREAELRFSPDRLGAPEGRLEELKGCNVHVMGGFDLGERPVLPFTSQA